MSEKHLHITVRGFDNNSGAAALARQISGLLETLGRKHNVHIPVDSLPNTDFASVVPEDTKIFITGIEDQYALDGTNSIDVAEEPVTFDVDEYKTKLRVALEHYIDKDVFPEGIDPEVIDQIRKDTFDLLVKRAFPMGYGEVFLTPDDVTITPRAQIKLTSSEFTEQAAANDARIQSLLPTSIEVNEQGQLVVDYKSAETEVEVEPIAELPLMVAFYHSGFNRLEILRAATVEGISEQYYNNLYPTGWVVANPEDHRFLTSVQAWLQVNEFDEVKPEEVFADTLSAYKHGHYSEKAVVRPTIWMISQDVPHEIADELEKAWQVWNRPELRDEAIQRYGISPEVAPKLEDSDMVQVCRAGNMIVREHPLHSKLWVKSLINRSEALMLQGKPELNHWVNANIILMMR